MLVQIQVYQADIYRKNNTCTSCVFNGFKYSCENSEDTALQYELAFTATLVVRLFYDVKQRSSRLVLGWVAHGSTIPFGLHCCGSFIFFLFNFKRILLSKLKLAKNEFCHTEINEPIVGYVCVVSECIEKPTI